VEYFVPKGWQEREIMSLHCLKWRAFPSYHVGGFAPIEAVEFFAEGISLGGERKLENSHAFRSSQLGGFR